MKAIVYEEFGSPNDVLHCVERPDPTPGPGEVLVRMIASPINPSDLLSVQGGYSITANLPATPGFEGVGIVEKSGGGFLGTLMKGKRVAVLNRDRGNWAEKTVVPVRQVIPIPKKMHVEQAATFFINPATAYILTRLVLRIPKGGWLLQTAANSELGKMIIRLGREFEFKTINIVRRESDVERLKFLGANEVIPYDTERDDFETLWNAVRRILPDGVPYALDPVGGTLGTEVSALLANRGQMVVFGTLSGDDISISPRILMTPNASIRGFWLGGWMQDLKLISKLKLVRKISQLIDAGILSSEVSAEFPLEQIREAVQASQQTDRRGKVLLRMSQK